jgi:hypothetical protein
MASSALVKNLIAEKIGDYAPPPPARTEVVRLVTFSVLQLLR